MTQSARILSCDARLEDNSNVQPVEDPDPSVVTCNL